MNQYCSVNDEGFHRFYEPISGLEVLIDDNTGTVNCTKKQEFETKPLLIEDAKELIQFMQLPGSGLGMLMIKLVRAFGRAVGAGSDAK